MSLTPKQIEEHIVNALESVGHGIVKDTPDELRTEAWAWRYIQWCHVNSDDPWDVRTLTRYCWVIKRSFRREQQ